MKACQRRKLGLIVHQIVGYEARRENLNGIYLQLYEWMAHLSNLDYKLGHFVDIRWRFAIGMQKPSRKTNSYNY